MRLNMIVITIITLALLIAGCSIGQETQMNTPNTDNDLISSGNDESGEGKVIIYFFWGDGCPHCTNQKPYLDRWVETYQDIEIREYETWKDRGNAALFQEVARAYGIEARGVPATFIGDKHWVGFSASMAGDMESQITRCLEEGCEGPYN